MDRSKDETASPASDRILDRKIESKALPSGFSSNLGRKAPAGDKGGPGKSVKAIVDWLEKTSTPGGENPELRTQEGRNKDENADSISSSPGTAKSDLVKATRPEVALASPLFVPKTPPTHPEEYSLTLLRYKSYFNNRPLARCLDDEEEKITTPAAKSTPKAASASSCYSIQKVDSNMATPKEIRDGMEPDSPTPLGRPGPKRRSRPEESSQDYMGIEEESCSSGGLAEAQTKAGGEVMSRDSAVVKAF
ncbi:hypothetical protein CONLIGDRAFT_399474 [Coniochaeta ligniaria NRRL 30616]|uniref:Uncharacterized protein n=1 Tax=Coniochaeta ligniaria NRRL 30616 TaxID=1408157 RepID=A0A1J7JMI3_9PEZI|nr:hypothetical protein CONLIGDRAFT_399474 [Coniochaeta ligniaria NRRL 30616]